MAKVTPPLHTIKAMSPGQYTEIGVLEKLAMELPDTFELFHSVDWSQARPAGDGHWEIDIIVLNQSGDLALLEVKAGSLKFLDQGMFKDYGGSQRNVGKQVQWQFQGIQQRLRAAGLGVRLMHFLVLPDATVSSEAGTIGFPRERLLDSTDCQALGGVILSRLGSGQPNAVRERVHAFLINRLRCKVEVTTLAGNLQSWTRFLSEGLTQWVPRIQAPSHIVRIQGTAGSGKTQLALGLLQQAVVHGKRAAYVCFNRPLADHMRDIAPARCEVLTFHQLSWQHRSEHCSPSSTEDRRSEVSAADLERAIDQYRNHMESAAADLDLLIVDELQDFTEDWLQILVRRVRALESPENSGTQGQGPEGLYLLDDPDQCLYPDRAELDISDAVVVTCRDNHRSPRRLVDVINHLQLVQPPITARAPQEGELPELRAWKFDSPDAMNTRTADAIQSCLDKGFSINQIAVLTWRGLERSQLLKSDQLGKWKVTRFTGQYDQHQRPIYTEGDLRLETLRRFKGQSAPAIVLTEIDEETWTDLHRRMLFVGMTRATFHLEIVLSDRVEKLLMHQALQV